MNTAEAVTIRPGDYQRAVEVLGLEEPFSDDEVIAGAEAWEKEHGTPLVRPGEEDSEGRPNAAFAQRVAQFQSTTTGPETMADPEVNRRELKKLMAVARKKGYEGLTKREKVGIHENQKSLGMPLTDFESASRTPKQITTDAEKAYAEIVRGSDTFKERLAAVEKLTDITTLQLFVEIDKHEIVREAAQARIQELEMAKVQDL